MTILHLKLMYVLVTFKHGAERHHSDVPITFWQHGFPVKVYSEQNIEFMEISFMYRCGNRTTGFTEYIQPTTRVLANDQLIKICKGDTGTCKRYGKRRKQKLQGLKGKEVVVSYSSERHFQIDKFRKAFSRQYLDLLSDCLQMSVDVKLDERSTDLALITDIILKDYMVYTPPIFDTSTYYAIRAARPLDKAVSLVKPFAWTIWMCLSITLPLFLISAYVLLRQEARLRNLNPPPFSTFFWIIIRSFLRQDTDIDNVYLETFRLMIGCWLLMTFVLTSGYLGILPSFMMYPGTEDIPKNFIQLGKAVRENRYKPLIFFMSDETSIFNFYQNYLPAASRFKNFNVKLSNIEIVDTFIKSLISNPAEKSLFDSKPALSKILDEAYCLLASKRVLDSLIMHWGKEKFYVSLDNLYTNFRFLQINTKRFNYAREVTNMVNLLAQSGIPDKIKKDEEEDIRRKYEFFKTNVEESENEPLKVEDIMGPLYLLLAGYVVSTLTLVAEIITHKMKVRKQRLKIDVENARNH
ncbi:uncharacterized protein LOC111634457 [Centruroides sculpturatus]|uniref:uncharacterized protein LOC111634457 n=1 Tax=Centruroides sculpturatus TaxID=218467 RepID=UPI000C6CA32D|nr:uncharacterized protein LOC111634457 [Centruroides sculpturatus]